MVVSLIAHGISWSALTNLNIHINNNKKKKEKKKESNSLNFKGFPVESLHQW